MTISVFKHVLLHQCSCRLIYISKGPTDGLYAVVQLQLCSVFIVLMVIVHTLVTSTTISL